MEAHKKLPEHKYKEYEKDGFHFFDMPMFTVLGTSASYKLRINLSDESYTPECKAEIIKIIQELNSKYDYNEKPSRFNRSPVLYGFKYTLQNKKEVEKSVNLNKIILEFLNAIKEKDKNKINMLQQYIQTYDPAWFAENIIKLENAEEVDKLIEYQKKVIFSNYRLVDQAQFTLYLSYFNASTSNITMQQQKVLGEFLQELNDRLSQMIVNNKKLEVGGVADSDSKISEFISLRQEKSSSGDEMKYIGATEGPEKLKALKQEQEKSALYVFLTTKVFNREEKQNPLETKVNPMRTFDLSSVDKIERICDNIRNWLAKTPLEKKDKPDPMPHFTVQLISTLCNVSSTADLLKGVDMENVKKILVQLGQRQGSKKNLEMILTASKAALIDENFTFEFRSTCLTISQITVALMSEKNQAVKSPRK